MKCPVFLSVGTWLKALGKARLKDLARICVKTYLTLLKTMQIVTFLLGVVVFAGAKKHRRPPGAGAPYL